MNEPTYRGYSYGVRHLVADRTVTLIEFVDEALGREPAKPELALGEIAGERLTAVELIEIGAVYVNDERSLNVSRGLSKGEHVRIHTRPRRYPRPGALERRIVEETQDLLIVDKPAGLPVHALVDNIKDNLISYLEETRGGRLYVTHRLDVETSGLVLLAKNPETQARLNRGFAEGTIKRVYAAYTEKPVAIGDYVHFMEPSPTAPKTVDAIERPGWQRCALTVVRCEVRRAHTHVLTEGHTGFRLERPLEEMYRLEIRLRTGRPQQIRAQLAALGAPIIGDLKYGSTHALSDAESGRTAVALQAIAISENG